MKRKATAQFPVLDALAQRRVIANRTWAVDGHRIDRQLTLIEVTGAPPVWALDLAEMFRTLAEAIECGSPEARLWAVVQLEILGDAFDPDCSTPEGIEP